ncbi:hypothetical protein BDN72DRAFT_278793 [Pluteus cervinus]|uniref:Uncharacterized protein n=1 Tax=Pluteus cervinus TaxID=181527 RepID=A0ACD3AFC5_9AGAR|nr:hypothetical protein BDN72DRAFT_278793 [Pluteus cervinus]
MWLPRLEREPSIPTFRDALTLLQPQAKTTRPSRNTLETADFLRSKARGKEGQVSPCGIHIDARTKRKTEESISALTIPADRSRASFHHRNLFTKAHTHNYRLLTSSHPLTHHSSASASPSLPHRSFQSTHSNRSIGVATSNTIRAEGGCDC